MADRGVPEREVSKDVTGQPEQPVQDSIDTVDNSEASNGNSTARSAEVEELGNAGMKPPAAKASGSGETTDPEKAVRMSKKRKAAITRFLQEECLDPGRFGIRGSDTWIENLLKRLEEWHCGGVKASVLKGWLAKPEFAMFKPAAAGSTPDPDEKKVVKLTEKMKQIIISFLKEEEFHPGRFGTTGEEAWIRELINRLEKSTTREIEPSDVQRWLSRTEFSESMKKLKQLEERQGDGINVEAAPNLEHSDAKEIPVLTPQPTEQPLDVGSSLSMEIARVLRELNEEVPVAGPSMGAEKNSAAESVASGSRTALGNEDPGSDGDSANSNGTVNQTLAALAKEQLEAMEVDVEPELEWPDEMTDATEMALVTPTTKEELAAAVASMTMDDVDVAVTFMDESTENEAECRPEGAECLAEGAESVTLSAEDEPMTEGVLPGPSTVEMTAENPSGESESTGSSEPESVERKEEELDGEKALAKAIMEHEVGKGYQVNSDLLVKAVGVGIVNYAPEEKKDFIKRSIVLQKLILKEVEGCTSNVKRALKEKHFVPDIQQDLGSVEEFLRVLIRSMNAFYFVSKMDKQK